ncbi:MAG: 4Fe-4S dicluster domain-containing protein, partial [Atopobium sp.]|nr:4Fe-4S dicluster domain-containing protein [Atopobium sp.]
DSSKCTVCGDCKNTCTTHAIDIDERGKLTIKMPVCVNCGACEIVCPEPGALTMVPMNTSELVVRDRKAEETERLEALARRKARFIFDTGKEQLKHLADSITEDSDESSTATAQQPPKEDNGE